MLVGHGKMVFLRQVSGLGTWARVLVIFLFAWGLLVLIFASKLNGPYSSVSDFDYATKRLNQAIEYVEQSKKRNAEIKTLIDAYIR